MKLLSGEGLVQGTGLCCRQSRLRGVIGALLVCAFLIGAVFLVRRSASPVLRGSLYQDRARRGIAVSGQREVPQYLWIGFAVVGALVVPLVLRDTFAKFRSTNWVLRVDPDGLWINLRPLQRHPAAGTATAIHLKYAEIARAHRHVDTWSVPSSEARSTHYKLESLDLHLASVDTRPLLPALIEARTAGKGLPTSVAVPAPDVIRVAWRGYGHDIVPALGPVLAELGTRVKVTDPTSTDRPEWRECDAEFEEQIAHLIRWGDPVEASGLLMRRCGWSATEAHKHLEELKTRV